MKVVALVHTEYHLLLLINEILRRKHDEFMVFLCQSKQNNRLGGDYNFNDVEASFVAVDSDVNLSSFFTNSLHNTLNTIRSEGFQELIFFQQQCPFILGILKSLKKGSIKISLFQDGLKPYVALKGYSLGMLRHDFSVWKWLLKNGIFELKPLKLLSTKKYAYLDEIDEVWLTFPESYDNWNSKMIKKVKFVDLIVLRQVAEKLFRWKNDFLPLYQNIIFYLNQPMHDEGDEEIFLLRKIQEQTKLQLIIKLHPLTTEFKQRQYQENLDCRLIQHSIPAEIFIMQLKDSIILSVSSTSLFFFVRGNKYYYMHNVLKSFIKRLQRYELTKSPASHINMINEIEEIV